MGSVLLPGETLSLFRDLFPNSPCVDLVAFISRIFLEGDAPLLFSFNPLETEFPARLVAFPTRHVPYSFGRFRA